jgi:3-oxoadipate enol-lactonase
VQAREEELFDEGRSAEAAELMARSWLAGPQREPNDVDSELYERVCAMVKRGYELQAGGEGSIKRVEIDLTRIATPTLVMRGALDWQDVASAAERFVRELPDAREEVVAGCAHLPTMERPDEVARLILAFLDA